MPKRPSTRAELVASDPFAGDDVLLDLTAFPDFDNPQAEQSLIDDRFAQLDSRGAGLGSQALKRFLSDPSHEDLEELAKATGDPDIVEEVMDRRREREAREFMKAHPAYYPTERNYSIVLRYLVEHDLPFERDTLAKAFKELTRAGHLEPRPGTTRQLTSQEERQLLADLISGESLDALLINYVSFRLGGKHPRQYRSPSDFLTANSKLASEFSFWAFFHLHPGYDHENEDWQAFAKRFFRLRPIATVPLIQAAYAQWEKQRNLEATERILRYEPQPTADDLENLNDDEIENLTQRTLQERGHAIARERREQTNRLRGQ